MRRTLLGLVMLAAGCTAFVGDPLMRPNGGRDRDDPSAPDSLERRIWRLTPAQYAASVRALGLDVAVTALPAQVSRLGYGNDVESSYVSDRDAEILASNAEQLAEAALQVRAVEHRCRAQSIDAACARALFANEAERAFRRAATDDELARYGASTTSSTQSGIRGPRPGWCSQRSIDRRASSTAPSSARTRTQTKSS